MEINTTEGERNSGLMGENLWITHVPWQQEFFSFNSWIPMCILNEEDRP